MTEFTFIIVTPSYNQADYIGKNLSSVSGQSGLIQHLVMDGNSTDQTVQILKKSHSKKLKWQSKKDKGQADAINQGLKLALKKATKDKLDLDQVIVAYLNSDDYYLDGIFGHVSAAFASKPTAKWLVGDAVIVNEHDQEIQSRVRNYKKWWRQRLSWSVLGVLNPIPQPAVFYKLSAIKKIGLFSPQLHYVMDYEYWLRLWKAFGPPILHPQPLAAFRIHSASKGGTGYTQQFREQYQTTTRYFSNPLLLLLQRMHNSVIVLVYKLIK